jgi:hypothetical protein
MNKVEVYSNWCYLDQLDGKTLENGEKIRVQWPNGEETQESVVVKKHSYMISDMGSPWEVWVSEAYVHGSIHGAQSLVRLTGDGILCERV